MAEKKTTAKKTSKVSSSDSMKPETKSLLAWLFAPITSVIWMNDTDKSVQFNAKQSLYFSLITIGLSIVLTVTVLLACLVPVVMIGDIGVRIYMAIKANKGEKVSLPLVGEWAK